MNRIRHSLKNGQSLVEMALLLPVLLLISVVAIDLGRGIYYYSAIYNAAREGARYGIIHPDNITGIEQKAIDMAVGVNLHNSNITVTPDPADNNIDTIKVSITYKFEVVTPIARLFTKCSCNSITLQTSSTMYVER
jgi:TadE-like protein